MGEALGEVVALGDLAIHVFRMHELAGVLDGLGDRPPAG